MLKIIIDVTGIYILVLSVSIRISPGSLPNQFSPPGMKCSSNPAATSNIPAIISHLAMRRGFFKLLKLLQIMFIAGQKQYTYRPSYYVPEIPVNLSKMLQIMLIAPAVIHLLLSAMMPCAGDSFIFIKNAADHTYCAISKYWQCI